jgi:hypothetical protein
LGHSGGGFDTPLNTPQGNAILAEGGAEPGALPVVSADPDLVRVIEAWPTLPARLRAAVLARVEDGPVTDGQLSPDLSDFAGVQTVAAIQIPLDQG